MPIKVLDDLPVKKALEDENIFVMSEKRAMAQDIRPLEIAILNLMPIKEDTELNIMRCLSNTPLQINVRLLRTKSYVGKNTSHKHLESFYQTFDEIRHENLDGMIITGAPVEKLEFEEVAYWDELKEIMEWTKTHVTSTFHICWGAQAGLFYHYGIPKHDLDKKLFGIYEHEVIHRKEPLMRGVDDYFYAPHSRYTEVLESDIKKHKELKILAKSKEAGVFALMGENGKQFFIFGHPEYDRYTLDKEYKRDVAKGIPIEVPKNYYPDDNPDNMPNLSWRAHSNAIYTNWLNYYVYQITPYNIDDVK